MPSTTRKAIVTSKNARLSTVERFMPTNYTASFDGTDIVITGIDVAGWTLDDYVLPRLASGGMYAREVEAEIATYEVVIHVTKGYRFRIEAGSREEAERFARNSFVEAGDDGDEVVYESIQLVDVTEATTTTTTKGA